MKLENPPRLPRKRPIIGLYFILLKLIYLLIKFSKTKDIAKNPTITAINEFEIILMRKYVIIIPTIAPGISTIRLFQYM